MVVGTARMVSSVDCEDSGRRVMVKTGSSDVAPFSSTSWFCRITPIRAKMSLWTADAVDPEVISSQEEGGGDDLRQTPHLFLTQEREEDLKEEPRTIRRLKRGRREDNTKKWLEALVITTQGR